MKRTAFLSALFLWAALPVFGAQMSVQIRNCKVRAKPSQLAPVVATVDYGDRVEAGALSAGWYPVTLAGGVGGWLHESALSKKAIKMTAGTGEVATGVSKDEVALAGKGFNEEVERKLRAEGKLDYTWVDRMAKAAVSEDAMIEFRSRGGLEGGGK